MRAPLLRRLLSHAAPLFRLTATTPFLAMQCPRALATGTRASHSAPFPRSGALFNSPPAAAAAVSPRLSDPCTTGRGCVSSTPRQSRYLTASAAPAAEAAAEPGEDVLVRGFFSLSG